MQFRDVRSRNKHITFLGRIAVELERRRIVRLSNLEAPHALISAFSLRMWKQSFMNDTMYLATVYFYLKRMPVCPPFRLRIGLL